MPLADGVAAREQQSTWWTNHYRCPCCSSQWEDGWDCQVDDDCGSCGLRHISPYYSDDGTGSEDERAAALARANEQLEMELALEAASPRPAG